MSKLPAARAPEPEQSESDRLAHEEASPVRRTAVVEQLVLPPLPTQPAARRRAITQREW